MREALELESRKVLRDGNSGLSGFDVVTWHGLGEVSHLRVQPTLKRSAHPWGSEEQPGRFHVQPGGKLEVATLFLPFCSLLWLGGALLGGLREAELWPCLQLRGTST